MNDDDERKLPLRYARRVSVRGLDEFGIPAPLLHEVGARLGHRGIEVWVKGGLLENWILLANAEAYYGWVRKSAVTRVRLRATGPQSRDICRELCALLDRGDPSSVLRAGFVEVKWTAHAGFLLIFVNRDAGCSENLFWRICEDAGQPACTWGDLGLGLDLINRCAQCSVYCPDEAIASHLRSYLNASTKEASREVIIANQLGIHSRPAALLARVANRFDSDIIIEGKSRLDNDLVQWAPDLKSENRKRSDNPVWGERVAADMKDLMDVMVHFQGAKPGTSLVIRALGPDAEEAVEQLAAVVMRGFDE